MTHGDVRRTHEGAELDPRTAARLTDLGPGERLVLVWLLTADAEEAALTEAEQATRMGIGLRTYERHAAELRRRGYVTAGKERDRRRSRMVVTEATVNTAAIPANNDGIPANFDADAAPIPAKTAGKYPPKRRVSSREPAKTAGIPPAAAPLQPPVSSPPPGSNQGKRDVKTGEVTGGERGAGREGVPPRRGVAPAKALEHPARDHSRALGEDNWRRVWWQLSRMMAEAGADPSDFRSWIERARAITDERHDPQSVAGKGNRLPYFLGVLKRIVKDEATSPTSHAAAAADR